MKRTIIIASVSMLAVSVIAAPQAYAKDRIEAPGFVSESNVANASQLETLWVDGRSQVVNGEEQVKDAQKDLRKAEKSENKASKKLFDARADISESRLAYARLVAGFGGAQTPDAAGKEAKALDKLVDDWGDAVKDVNKATDELRKAQSEISTAKSRLRTGNELIATGREKILVAERRASPATRTSDVRIEN